jgi:hypothetical protein
VVGEGVDATPIINPKGGSMRVPGAVVLGVTVFATIARSATAWTGAGTASADARPTRKLSSAGVMEIPVIDAHSRSELPDDVDWSGVAHAYGAS